MDPNEQNQIFLVVKYNYLLFSGGPVKNIENCCVSCSGNEGVSGNPPKGIKVENFNFEKLYFVYH